MENINVNVNSELFFFFLQEWENQNPDLEYANFDDENNIDDQDPEDQNNDDSYAKNIPRYCKIATRGKKTFFHAKNAQ